MMRRATLPILVLVTLCWGLATRAASPVEVAVRVDAAIRALPENAEAAYAPPITDDAFLRRGMLDAWGRVPRVDEVAEFRVGTQADKRPRTVERLVGDERFGRNVAGYWRDTILSRRLEERAMRVADPLVNDLADWINAGEGWDQIATRFITATGTADENGATAIIMAQDGRTEEIAAEVSRLFLGVQIQCAQCHDHPWDSWKREEFHELAAFFPRVGARQVKGSKPRTFQVVVNDRPDKPRFRNGNNVNRRGRPEHYMADLERPEEPATRIQPRFFLTGFQRPIGATDEARRYGLAEELVQNEWFARAIVNRVWTELIGEGFYDTVDDIGPERSAVAETVLVELTAGFVESGYRLKWLYRTVMLTDAYARESRPADRVDEGIMMATVAQPLRAEPLLDSLMAVLGSPRGADAKQQRKVRNQALRAVNEAFGFDPSEPRENVVGTIPQSLMLMNSPVLARRASARTGSMLDKLIDRHTSGDRIDHDAALAELFDRTLTRPPTESELAAARRHVAEARRPQAVYEDVLWSLLNTAEFSHRR
ncbi:MAG: DUF1549 domain-containing protein [Planctomycetota bacterium]